MAGSEAANAPISAPGGAIGRSGRIGMRLRAAGGSLIPILAVVAAILAIWYVAVAPMNIHGALDTASREGVVVTPDSPAARRQAGAWGLVLNNAGVVPRAYDLDRPQLPAPHQVAAELWDTVAGKTDHLQTQPCLSRLGHAERDIAGLCDRHGAGHRCWLWGSSTTGRWT